MQRLMNDYGVELLGPPLSCGRKLSEDYSYVDGHPVPDASDLDFYLFDREARMDEVWGPERASASLGSSESRMRPAGSCS